VQFEGDMPSIAADSFSGADATVYYPEESGTWVPGGMQNYGGALVWWAYQYRGTCGQGVRWVLSRSGELFVFGNGNISRPSARLWWNRA